MVGNAGATANGAEREYATEDPARGGPASGTRRQVMRGLFAPALAVGLAPLIAASRPSSRPPRPRACGR